MDELEVGCEFTDVKGLSAAVAQFENGNFVQFYKKYRTVMEDVLLQELNYLFHIYIYMCVCAYVYYLGPEFMLFEDIISNFPWLS